MKKSLLFPLFMTLTISTFAQPTLRQLWQSDSLSLKGPESALFDPTSQSLYVSSMGSGSIVRMDLHGKIMQADWVTGLHSNKGSALYNGLLYTAETTAVAVIDVKKATILKRIPIEGAVMLNDVAVDAKGIIYVSDTRTGKVYRIEVDQPSLFLDNIPGANGILTVNTDVYIVGSTTFLKVNANKEVTRIADGFESGLDGIVMIRENEFLLSNYHGILYFVRSDGTKKTVLDTRNNRIMSNDISYDSSSKTLFVPSFSTNQIIAYEVQ